jgi:hypothetical protein
MISFCNRAFAREKVEFEVWVGVRRACPTILSGLSTPEIMACDSLAASHRGIPVALLDVTAITIDDSISSRTVDLKLLLQLSLENHFDAPIKLHQTFPNS